MNNIFCFSYFWAKHEYREQLIIALTKLIKPTRAEIGCLQYTLLLDTENPNLLIMLEEFTDQAAFDAHEDQPYIKFFVEHEMNDYCERVSWHVAKIIKDA